MEGYRFSFTSQRFGSDDDVEMPPSESETHVAKMLFPQEMESDKQPVNLLSQLKVESQVVSGAESCDKQMVLHSSRRRRASEELTPYHDQSSSTPANGGWRPVRLQGYSEDPMKDEVIRDQTEKIKSMQTELQNLQKDSNNRIVADHRAKEAEEALQKEQVKAAQQEELIKRLQNELKIYQDATQTGNVGGPAHRQIEQNEQSPRPSIPLACKRTVEAPISSSAVTETVNDISMDLDRRCWGEYNDAELIGVPSNSSHNTSSEHVEHQPKPPSVPLPLSFKRIGGRRRPTQKPLSPPPPLEPSNDSTPTNTSTFPSSQEKHAMSLEAKIDLILDTLGAVDGKSRLPKDQRGRRLPVTEFRVPRMRVPKPEGRNERLTWVRKQLHDLLGLRQDRDILNDRDVLYSSHPLKDQMAQFERDVGGSGPTTLVPMQVNWTVVYRRWNECLLGLFLTHCKEHGYGNGHITQEDENEIGEIFFKRLERIQGIINEYRPKSNESISEADQRYSDRHLLKLSAARRNRRRGELFNARCDTNMDHLPDTLEDVEHAAEETKRWIDQYKINEALGVEGTSSDETDPCDSDTYDVHIFKWRGKELARKMRSTDAARRTTNEYGNSRPGNRPHTRRRRGEPKVSLRKAPAGLPVNCYDKTWYAALSPRKKRDLGAKPALELLATWESE